MSSSQPSHSTQTTVSSSAVPQGVITRLVNDLEPTSAPISWREVTAVISIIFCSDVVIYRGHGFSGVAAFLVVVPVLLWLGVQRPQSNRWTWLIVGLLVLLSGRLAWCGSVLGVLAGMFLICAFALTLFGQPPHVLETIAFGLQAFTAGCRGLLTYAHACAAKSGRGPKPRWLNILLPVATCLVFGVIFVLANPKLSEFFSSEIEQVLVHIRQWLAQVSFLELAFWGATAWLTLGLLRPVAQQSLLDAFLQSTEQGHSQPAILLPAFRNTLVAVVLLFAVYLVFEFQTLWFRVFPEGFHYSGYAHEGAAWLTCALALATVLLSLIFRGEVLYAPRLPGLKKLAWVWAAENFVLAVAVFHRLFIYIGFNGMTRMRTIGMFGIACVVVGFAMVVWKIVRHRDFVWLLRYQLLTVAGAAYLFALTPVDSFAMRYNVRRILAGDHAPAVQISVHPITAEGWFYLAPLLDCDHETIRNGLRTMHAERMLEAENKQEVRLKKGWTAHQFSDERLSRELQRHRSSWTEFEENIDARRAALREFHKCAFQWF